MAFSAFSTGCFDLGLRTWALGRLEFFLPAAAVSPQTSALTIEPVWSSKTGVQTND